MAIAADGAGSTPIATLNPAINITPISASGSSNRHLKKATALQKQQDNGDEWEGEDYTTRCLCDMIHNDEFMIECERCKYAFYFLTIFTLNFFYLLSMLMLLFFCHF